MLPDGKMAGREVTANELKCATLVARLIWLIVVGLEVQAGAKVVLCYQSIWLKEAEILAVARMLTRVMKDICMSEHCWMPNGFWHLPSAIAGQAELPLFLCSWPR
jgi:hypothetical protein